MNSVVYCDVSALIWIGFSLCFGVIRYFGFCAFLSDFWKDLMDAAMLPCIFLAVGRWIGSETRNPVVRARKFSGELRRSLPIIVTHLVYMYVVRSNTPKATAVGQSRRETNSLNVHYNQHGRCLGYDDILLRRQEQEKFKFYRYIATFETNR